MPRDWSTACLDWEDRITHRRTLIPDNIEVFDDEANRALRIFKRLKCPDVEGFPTYGELCDDWILDIVRVIFGSYDAAIKRRMIREFFVLVPKKNGKALSLDTEIATPTGFITMRDVKPGDEVIGDDGKPTSVTWKGPIYADHDCYEVEFSTGEKVVADAGHLWVTDAHADRSQWNGIARNSPRPTIKTTEEIARTLHVKSGKFIINNHRVSLPAPLALPEARLIIDPYVLGAWLGDGTSEAACVTCGNDDAQEMLKAITACGQSAYAIARPSGAVKISLTDPSTRNRRVEYRFWTEAKRLGIIGKKAIPPIYLRGSFQQRLALLQGLMDTDGTISTVGQASFTTTTPALRDGFVELVNSLGFKASPSERRATLNGRDCGPKWDIQFWPFNIAPVFRLKRKLDRQRACKAANSSRSKTRQIVACRKIGSIPVQCIAVDNATKQFLITRSLIPTHNSSIAAAIMVTAAIMNRRPAAECLLIAPTKKIADIAFTQADGIIRLDPKLAALFHSQPHQRTITHRQTLAVIIIKAADKEVITGSKATFILVDETHVFAQMSRAEKVFVEIRGSLAARMDGFLLQISTQSKEPPVGLFKTELKIARDVRDGRLKLPLLPIIYELPQAIAKDDGWKNQDNWPLVNPNLGKSVDPSYLVDELIKAEENGPVALALLASQHFNVEIGQHERGDGWSGARLWPRGIEKGLTLKEIIHKSEVLTAGTDGGGMDDLLGVAVIGREKGTQRWLGWAHAFISPEGWERRKANHAVYSDFIKEGDLTLVEHLPDDVSAVVDIVKQCLDSDKLAQVGADPAGLGSIVDALAGIGVTQENKMLGGVYQGVALMGAFKTIERKLADGSFKHGGRPMMAWCAGNAIVKHTGTGQRIERDLSGYGKIDPLMALFDAAALMAMNPEPKRKPQFQVMFA